jgi:hypothetical protein
MVDRPETIGELRSTLRVDFRRNTTVGQRLTLAIFRLGQFCHASQSRLVWVLHAGRGAWANVGGVPAKVIRIREEDRARYEAADRG